MSNNLPVMSIRHLTFGYDASTSIFEDVNMDIFAGDVISLFSPSGTGKSTLLQLIGLLDKPKLGDIECLGRSTRTLSDAAVTAIRRESVGYIYQFHHLLPDLTLYDNVALPLQLKGKSRSFIQKRIENLLKEFGLNGKAFRYPSQLSGGEKQRVAFIRALIHEPKLIVADEPTGNLDPEVGQVVMQALIQKAKVEQTAVIFCTHNIEHAKMADLILTFKHKKLVRFM